MRLRRTTRQADARAVRNAVSVEACRIPTGWPVSENRVMAPTGLILGFPPASSCFDWGGERVITISSDQQGHIDLRPGARARARQGARTPLTPTPAGLLEGMNRVVAPVLDELTDCR